MRAELRDEIVDAWSKHLLGTMSERLVYQLGLYASEGWVASECAWALRDHDAIEVVVERHLANMSPGLRADLAILPRGGHDAEATHFEFKVAWCESEQTARETVSGVKRDVESRRTLPDVYSVILGFQFDWRDAPAPPRFRWRSGAKQAESMAHVTSWMAAKFRDLGMTSVIDPSVRVEGVRPTSTHLHLSIWRHPAAGCVVT